MFVSYIFPTTSPVKLISNALSHVREELETVEHRTVSFTLERVRSCLPEASTISKKCSDAHPNPSS